MSTKVLGFLSTLKYIGKEEYFDDLGDLRWD
jgi:hypothetical protein